MSKSETEKELDDVILNLPIQAIPEMQPEEAQTGKTNVVTWDSTVCSNGTALFRSDISVLVLTYELWLIKNPQKRSQNVMVSHYFLTTYVFGIQEIGFPVHTGYFYLPKLQ